MARTASIGGWADCRSASASGADPGCHRLAARRRGRSRTTRGRCRAGRATARPRTVPPVRRRTRPATRSAASSCRSRPAPRRASAPPRPRGSGARSAADATPDRGRRRGTWSLVSSSGPAMTTSPRTRDRGRDGGLRTGIVSAGPPGVDGLPAHGPPRVRGPSSDRALRPVVGPVPVRRLSDGDDVTRARRLSLDGQVEQPAVVREPGTGRLVRRRRQQDEVRRHPPCAAEGPRPG